MLSILIIQQSYSFASDRRELTDMEKEAKQILKAVSNVIYNKGFFFRTPEGWDTEGQFTATMYMRPNAIWALEL